MSYDEIIRQYLASDSKLCEKDHIPDEGRSVILIQAGDEKLYYDVPSSTDIEYVGTMLTIDVPGPVLAKRIR